MGKLFCIFPLIINEGEVLIGILRTGNAFGDGRGKDGSRGMGIFFREADGEGGVKTGLKAADGGG
tara:strand:+ start:723 stop:917 length:195 start_codon:yes stop_codon:yes gene_type:complete